MCTPVVVIFFVPAVNKIGAVHSAAHALGSAGVMGPWGSHKAHLQCPRGDLATAAPGRLRHPLCGHYADFPLKKLTRVLEGRSMPRLDRTAQETGHV